MSFTKHLLAVFFLSVVLVLEMSAQDSTTSLIDRAYSAQNPNESLRILSQVSTTENLVDTVSNRYYLTKGIAYGQLGKADSSILFMLIG